MDTGKNYDLLSIIRNQPNYGSTNPTAFIDNKGRFIPQTLGDEIKDDFQFVTSENNEIYYFDKTEGLFKRAENFILQEAQKRLDEFSNQDRCRETLFYIKTSTYKTNDFFSPPLNLLPLKNCIFDLESKQKIDYTKELFFTSKLPINYNPEASCPGIEKFLSEIVSAENVLKLKECAAYCLHRGYPIQKSIMLLGGGENGKSTLINLFTKFLGSENVSNVSLQELASDRFASADLHRKMGNFFADLSKEALRDSGKFKTLFGDEMSAQRKGQQRFKFRNYAKLIFSANELPPTPDDSIAFHRRWVLIEFPNRFTAGVNAKGNKLEEITTETELSGFMNECIKLLPILLERGNFDGSMSPEDSRNDYIRRSDPLGSFIRDKIEFATESWITKDDLYLAFVKYCNEAKVQPSDKGKVGNTFAGKVTKLLEATISNGRPTVNGKRVTAWMGIRFKDAEPHDDITKKDAEPHEEGYDSYDRSDRSDKKGGILGDFI